MGLSINGGTLNHPRMIIIIRKLAVTWGHPFVDKPISDQSRIEQLFNSNGDLFMSSSAMQTMKESTRNTPKIHLALVKQHLANLKNRRRIQIG